MSDGTGWLQKDKGINVQQFSNINILIYVLVNLETNHLHFVFNNQCKANVIWDK